MWGATPYMRVHQAVLTTSFVSIREAATQMGSDYALSSLDIRSTFFKAESEVMTAEKRQKEALRIARRGSRAGSMSFDGLRSMSIIPGRSDPVTGSPGAEGGGGATRSGGSRHAARSNSKERMGVSSALKGREESGSGGSGGGLLAVARRASSAFIRRGSNKPGGGAGGGGGNGGDGAR